MILASTPRSPLVEFVQVFIERRASSIEIQEKYRRASVTLHLSGTVQPCYMYILNGYLMM